MTNYTRCLHCQSQQIHTDLGVQDAGAYPSGSHKVAVEESGGGHLFGKKKERSSLLRAYVCGECGFTALFAQEPGQLTKD